MEALGTIISLFLLIGLGWFAHYRGFIPPEFLGPANRLTYYFAIPALLFRAVSKASLREEFHGGVLLATLASAAIVYIGGWIICRRLKLPPSRAGTMVQSSAHGNLGYIGLPFAFYFLGEPGLIKAGIIAGFLMILQNVLSVSVLYSFSTGQVRGGKWSRLLTNPVILSSMMGIAFSGFGIGLPQVIARALDMLGGLAPPMALLLIGASISFGKIRRNLSPVMISACVKLVLLPAMGLAMYRALGFPGSDFLPGLILLASPTATVAYIMAQEMDGDPDLATETISASTLFSGATYLLWLTLVPGTP
ncbi:MAG: AEC family transporter [Pseudomonadota bacterium]|jgi:hypothetical protein